MIVDVTMHQSYATIENVEEKVCIHMPLIGPLKARMLGRSTAKFKAEFVGSSLELGDAVGDKLIHGIKGKQ